MPRAVFTINGIEGLATDLEFLASTIRVSVGRANGQTAAAVQSRAQALSPKDRGDLARSIQIRGRDLNWRVGLVDEDLLSRGGRNAAHRNPSQYGVWYEFGFVSRNISAQPFMGPASQAEEGPHLERLIAAIDEASR